MSYPSERVSTSGKPRAGFRARAFRIAASIFVVCVLMSAARPVFAEEAVGPLDGPVRRYVVWPLAFVDEAEQWRQFSFVPFYVNRESADGSEKRVQFLWPIWLYRRSGKDVSIRLLPVYTYWKDYFTYKGAEANDVHYMLFPFIFGSESPDEGKSFAFFPIGGKMKNFLGRDEIGFFLFPLYMEYSKGEMRQRNYLWPVLSFSEGGGYDGFRLWPLYGRFEKEGEFRRDFRLWPIYSRQRFDLDKEQTGERMMLFPLFAREDSASRRYRSVLWPFFGHDINYARDFEEWSAPWPFYVKTRGTIHQNRLWPFYGYKRTVDRESWFVAWPFLQRRETDITENAHLREFRFMPIVSYETETTASGEIVSHKERVWPLWRYRRSEDGSSRFKMLSLLWFSDERGFERAFSPLWTIYDRVEEPDGDRKVRALWGLIKHSREGSRGQTRIPLVYSRVSDTETGMEEARLFGGLIASVREGEQRKIKLFYFKNPFCGESPQP
jgi:hypothetical protein